jgi:hypothetical protein
MFLINVQMIVDGETNAVQFHTFLALEGQLHVPPILLLQKNPWHSIAHKAGWAPQLVWTF